MRNILTVDVEEWYHALFSQQGPGKSKHFESRVGVIYRLLDLLEKAKTKGTFFVLGEVAERSPAVIRDIAGQGHEIGVHGYRHRLVSQMDSQEFKEDIRKTKGCIEKIISTPLIGYRAPAFSVKRNMDWVFKVLAEEGFQYDSSIFPIRGGLYGDHTAPQFPFWIEAEDYKIKEFPLSTLKIGKMALPVAGGFYLRNLPFLLILHSIKKINSLGFPFILYLHPWDIDSQQPKPSGITIRERFTHYFNLSSTFRKLQYLFDNFEFTSIADLEQSNEA